MFVLDLHLLLDSSHLICTLYEKPNNLYLLFHHPLHTPNVQHAFIHGGIKHILTLCAIMIRKLQFVLSSNISIIVYLILFLSIAYSREVLSLTHRLPNTEPTQLIPTHECLSTFLFIPLTPHVVICSISSTTQFCSLATSHTLLTFKLSKVAILVSTV